MHHESREQPIQSEWKDETAERANVVMAFLKSSIEGIADGTRRYDSLTELHYSGGDSDVMAKVKTGEAVPTEVSAYYENDELKQLHVVYASEKGANLDVYIKGKALEDFEQLEA